MTPDFKELLQFIKQDRLRKSTDRGALIESESDKGRIVNSSAFRRLQQKAQVFPLEPNAAVRSRLTHSIEVSQVGRHLAQKIIKKCGGSAGDYETLSAFVNTVESACLIHDIGNPPFGHFGEFAIQSWFIRQKLNLGDLEQFDGNPQGFRIVSYLSGNDSYGMNLTATLLLSSVKYPWHKENKPAGKRKIGVFSSDWPTYEHACRIVGWQCGKPFPFMQIMDTADEIAYSLSDIEDGLEKGIISMRDLQDEFGRTSFPLANIREMIPFKIKIINHAVEMAATQFCQKLRSILDGNREVLILPHSEISDVLHKIREFVRNKIYTHAFAEQVELAGHSVVDGLLNQFGSLIKRQNGVELDATFFSALLSNDDAIIKNNHLHVEARLAHKLPPTYREKYQNSTQQPEILRRSHLVTDFISGMTDDFALDTFQILKGIKIK